MSAMFMARAGLKPIGPIAPNLAPCSSYLHSVVQVHKTTHCRFYREQLGLAPPKADPVHDYLVHGN